MENLTIVSTTTNVQAKEVINGNTVNYSYNYEAGEAPLAVVFNVQRGVQGGEGFTGQNAMSGTYFPQNDKFDVNTSSYQSGDGAIQEAIYATCKAIIVSLTPEPEE